MHSAAATPETVRQHAEVLLASIEVSRIIVVDDEYSEERPEVEELLGICTAVEAAQAVELPHLDNIDFEADRDIWADLVRKKWDELEVEARRELLVHARSLEAKTSAEPDEEPLPSSQGADSHGGDEALQPPPPDTGVDENGVEPSPLNVGDPLTDGREPVDIRAAESLEQILAGLEQVCFLTLSLKEWRGREDEFLADGKAATTVFLFDCDFSREVKGTANEGFNLVRELQRKGVGYCGLISHTIQLGTEYEAWQQLAEEHSLERDNFVVIAKERLTGESPDYYGFLRMLRLVALSKRYAGVKSKVWRVFEASVAEAKAAVERLSVLDFDQIVFASSRYEGVWEPDTLFRVFSILMRREARASLHRAQDIPEAVAVARRISALPEEVAAALGEEMPSRGALWIQRFETYESEATLNRLCLPIDLGDIFEKISTGRHYVLLSQPCDLMVRNDGRRSYEGKMHGRTAALVELVVGRTREEAKETWGELPFYDEDTGAPAFADFAKAHHVQLAVLDLCAFRDDGVAEIEVGGACPELLIEPWKKRHERLQKFFEAALGRYERLGDRGGDDQLKLLALPAPSTTAQLRATVSGKAVKYDLKRVMRLRQPWSGALLTAFTQYQARAAFEHPFDRRVPLDAEPKGGRGSDGNDGGASTEGRAGPSRPNP